MMREILFRGKRTNGGFWLCGDLRQWSEHRIGICDKLIGQTIEIDPATVGQFTGLTDKNGKKIFEGDIVAASLQDGNYKGFTWGRQAVVFSNGVFCLEDSMTRKTPLCSYAPSVVFEIIGNVHDNPELLKEEIQ